MKTKLAPKAIIFFFLIIIGFVFVSCKTEDDQEIITTESRVNIYKGASDSEDGLQADVSDGEYKTYFYGDFHQNGSPKNIKSIILEKKQNDTLYNFLLDDKYRIYMAYMSLKNGDKLSKITKINFVDNSNAFMNFYDYNWQNNTDTLVKQISLNYDNQTATSTYGKFEDDEEFEVSTNDLKRFLAKHSGIIGGIAIVATALTCGGSAGLACGPALLIVSTAVMILNSNIVKADILNPNVPRHYPSPTSGSIPNPISSPAIPSISNIYGKWKVVKRVSSSGIITYPNCVCGIGADACYTLLQSNGALSQSCDGVNFSFTTNFSLNGHMVLFSAGNATTINLLNNTELVWTANNITVYFTKY